MSEDESGGEAMNAVERLTAESKTINVLGEEIEIHPFENDEFLEYIREAQKKEQRGEDAEVLPFLVTKVLKKHDDSITRKQVGEAPMELMTKTINAIEEVNGIEDFMNQVAEKEQKAQL